MPNFFQVLYLKNFLSVISCFCDLHKNNQLIMNSTHFKSYFLFKKLRSKQQLRNEFKTKTHLHSSNVLIRRGGTIKGPFSAVLIFIGVFDPCVTVVAVTLRQPVNIVFKR